MGTKGTQKKILPFFLYPKKESFAFVKKVSIWTERVQKSLCKLWLDSKHTPIDIPYKLTARWFGPFEVLSSDGAAVTLDLPEMFGKAHRKVNIRRLKFYEERDSFFGPADVRPEPLMVA